jgi:predicted nucleic acid-binding Zn ribbon protein
MERLGGDVERELSRFGPQGRIGALVAAWPRAVGEGIARNAWPARVARDGTLYAHTVDAVWAFELTQHASEIAARFGVSAIRFAPGPLPSPGEPSSAPAAPAVVAGPEEVERAAALAAPIEDEELRALVARAAAASLARGASDRGLW